MKKSLMIALLVGAAASPVLAQNTPAATPAPAAAPSAAKKQLLDRLVALQQPGLESMAVGLTEQPLRQMLGAAQQALGRVPEDKRQAAITQIEGLAKKYSDDMRPIAKDKAAKLGQSALGPMLNERFTEDELRQLLVALEAPAYKKYQAALPELGNAFTDDEIRAFDKRIREAMAGAGEVDYCASPKFDGLAVELVYEKGELAVAANMFARPQQQPQILPLRRAGLRQLRQRICFGACDQPELSTPDECERCQNVEQQVDGGEKPEQPGRHVLHEGPDHVALAVVR